MDEGYLEYCPFLPFSLDSLDSINADRQIAERVDTKWALKA